MADPTLREHDDTYDRWTLQNIRDYAMFAAGGEWSDLNSTEQGLLDKLINAAHASNRRLVKGAHRYAEDDVILTWIDGDDSIAIPATVGEIVGQHIWICDSDGFPLDKIEILREEVFLDGFLPQPGATDDPVSKWDGSSTPVARIYRADNTTLARVLWVYPRPDADTKFKILYLAETTILDDASDVLEAPLAYHYLIALDAAIAWLTARGGTAKADALRLERMKHEAELVGARETEKPARARFYDEVGYPGTRQGEPNIELLPGRP